jgi:hypothetical protein
VPESNFIYLQGGTYVYAQPPVGMAVAAGVTINVVANLVISGIEYARAAVAREAMGPVGTSVQDIDLRRTVFAQLASTDTIRQDAPVLRLSAQPFPKAEPDAARDATRGPTGTDIKTTTPDPMQPLIERARAGEADATLFVRVVPLFRDATGAASVLNSSWLYAKSGKLLSSWSVKLPGPTPPDADQSALVRWWAEGRYRRFIAQGVRAVVRPIAEDLLQPTIFAQRQADMERSLAKMAEVKVVDPMLRQTGAQVQGSTANALRMKSTGCSVESDDKLVIYRYERVGRGTSLAVAAYCPGETLDLWSQELVPGLSWLTESLPAPVALTTTTQ